MTSDPRELVARLDALAVSIPPQWVVQDDTIWSSHSTMIGDRYVDDAICQGGANQRRYLNFIAALRNAYPSLRAAVLRCVELERVRFKCACGATDVLGCANLEEPEPRCGYCADMPTRGWV